MPFPWENYLLYGVVPGYTSGTVTATNKATGESQTENVTADGSFVIDCANFIVSGWSDLNTVELQSNGRYLQVSINKGAFAGERRVDIKPPHYNHSHKRH